MSQQPPYGEPQQPGQQPYSPYSQGAYPNPYAQMPQQPNHTTRNVLLIVGLVILLFCGGLTTLGFLAFRNVDDAFENEYVGSRNDPIAVEEGEAFEIRGFTYEEGWAIEGDENGYLSVSALRGTNDRDDEDPEQVALVFTLVRDNEVVGDINCNGTGEVTLGRSVTLDCSSGETLVDFDELEVHDTSFYE